MPWYRSGTVAINAGQNTVTGTGTNFSANSRVGDAFQGPDGRWYEVTNIASATVLSILPAYQGGTVNGGAYGLAPMQGYVKESADRLRQIVEQWGSTLASLGAVATENVVPIAKGGTGSTTASAARAALGLGTGATRNVGTGTDELMTRGAYGLGQSYSPGLKRVSSMNGYEVESTGFYRYDVDTTGRPPFGAGYGSLIQLSASFSANSNYGSQIFVDYVSNEIGVRSLNANGFTSFRKIYTDGNTTRASDGTLKAI